MLITTTDVYQCHFNFAHGQPTCKALYTCTVLLRLPCMQTWPNWPISWLGSKSLITAAAALHCAAASNLKSTVYPVPVIWYGMACVNYIYRVPWERAHAYPTAVCLLEYKSSHHHCRHWQPGFTFPCGQGVKQFITCTHWQAAAQIIAVMPGLYMAWKNPERIFFRRSYSASSLVT